VVHNGLVGQNGLGAVVPSY